MLIEVAYDLVGERRREFPLDSASGNEIKSLAIGNASMCEYEASSTCEYVGKSLKFCQQLYQKLKCELA